jgi:hypothetical protein
MASYKNTKLLTRSDRTDSRMGGTIAKYKKVPGFGFRNTVLSEDL